MFGPAVTNMASGRGAWLAEVIAPDRHFEGRRIEPDSIYVAVGEDVRVTGNVRVRCSERGPDGELVHVSSNRLGAVAQVSTTRVCTEVVSMDCVGGADERVLVEADAIRVVMPDHISKTVHESVDSSDFEAFGCKWSDSDSGVLVPEILARRIGPDIVALNRRSAPE